MLNSLQDVRRWLATREASSNELEMGSIREAVDGHFSCVPKMLRPSASSVEQPAAEIQEKQDSPQLADAAPGKALNICGTCYRNGIA